MAANTISPGESIREFDAWLAAQSQFTQFDDPLSYCQVPVDQNNVDSSAQEVLLQLDNLSGPHHGDAQFTVDCKGRDSNQTNTRPTELSGNMIAE